MMVFFTSIKILQGNRLGIEYTKTHPICYEKIKIKEEQTRRDI